MGVFLVFVFGLLIAPKIYIINSFMPANKKITKNVISIRGARVHNLKNIDVDIPRNKLTVITGLSGSGKSSLAFDTLYADGQRRYVESLSAYARQFLGVMEKPDVDNIEGISPAISIDQKSVSKNPRSTVGTITEIYDYLRLLFARVGIPHCPKCGREVKRQSAAQIMNQILALPAKTPIVILAPVIRGKKGEHKSVIEEIARAGFSRVRINGEILRVEDAQNKSLARYKIHDIEVVVDRFEVGRSADDRMRLASSVETALKMGNGIIIVNIQQDIHPERRRGITLNNTKEKTDMIFSEMFACEHCGINLPELEPRTFSFNSPHGACPKCTGIGYQLDVDSELVVPNPRLTIAEGAIRPWMAASHRLGRQSWYWWMLSEFSDRKGFSLNDPWLKLPKGIQQEILFGEKQEEKKEGLLALRSLDEEGAKFEGVVPNLLRRYQASDSDWTRAEIEKYMVIKECSVCKGKRLRLEALAVTVGGRSIDVVTALSIKDAQRFFGDLSSRLSKNHKIIARMIVKEVINRLQFLIDVGLDYLTLDRSAQTLSGGEGQRIRLATQIGTRLTGVLYILDEPSVGLHPRDQARLIKTLKDLRDLGNTVVVVEHDPQTILAADWVIDVGPAAGKHGGRIVFTGTAKELLKAKTLTGEYLAGKKHVGRAESKIVEQAIYRNPSAKKDNENKSLIIYGAKEHNLKNIDVKIPIGKFVCLTGVSGSGKSTLLNDILARALLKHFWNAKEMPGKHSRILGIENIDKAIVIDQSPIGRTPRSNPATYTGAFTIIRTLFAATKEAKVRGYGPGRFSFNVKGGRCENCQGEGMRKIEMQFLAEVWVECEECHGTRYNKDALEITWRGKNIAQILEMTVEEAFKFFAGIPTITAKLRTLNDVGLGYINFGQSATTLSGGEAQRIKLSTELARRTTGKTLYILDEPTTGLHFADIDKLLGILRGLVNLGNTVLVIEHNMDVIKCADWVIDLGPEGGDQGGRIIAEGTVKEIAKNKNSYTGQYLKNLEF